ncbi:DNA mismatch repair protein MutS [Mycoplasmatota bacterium]|nr:DNA mismatch repair protein MutS [Mycoplasmatota bacterium]
MNKFINGQVKKVISFNDLMKEITIHSAYGNFFLHHLTPFDSKDELLKEYHLIEKFIQHFNDFDKLERILDKFKDIKLTLKNCKEGKILDIVDLYEIKIQAIYMNELKKVFNPFDIELLTMNDCQDIIQLLSSSNNDITTDFTIYNSYSEHLKEIRLEKRKIEHQYFKADDKNREQLQILRSKYVILEADEELKVRKKLTHQLQNMVCKMEDNISKISHIDVLIGKAKMAVKYHAVKPTISENLLSLVDMENPLIKNQVEQLGNHYTKNSIEMYQGTTILTGANMSGKSSVIKTVALNVCLAHLGFYVFAKEAFIPIVSGIEYVGYESENVIHGLSSFGFEIASINNTIEKMKKNTYLICVDEFARSTNPSEGQKFVKAFAEFSKNYSSYTLLATHYDGVVTSNMNHYQIEGLKDEEIDSVTIHSIKDFNRFMNYTLKKVTKIEQVPKEAYKVSVLLDIDKDFKAYLDKCYEE